MKILVIGSGGREHAIAWKIKQSSLCDKLFASPGNAGMSEIAECLPPSSSDPQAFLDLAREKDVDLTVVGPEANLVAGVVDLFRANGKRIIGPTKNAARLEGSKVFAKDFLKRGGIPTARFETAERREDVADVVSRFDYPLVLKADGLAAGKGVIIVHEKSELETAIPKLPEGRVVVEECLVGEEVSFIVLCEGGKLHEFETTQDHKAVFDDDKGPNTGGMGAYCDTRILNDAERKRITDEVVQPTLRQIAADGDEFTGFLYVGLMMTSEGPKVLEFNVRLGDPEAQPLMHRMSSDFLATLADGAPMEWSPEPSVCVVLAAHGYPGTPRAGDLITGIESCGATVFQAGTKKTEKGLVTAGGRVLGVSASGPDLAKAISNAYSSVSRIHFEGMHYRTDIGKKGLRRW